MKFEILSSDILINGRVFDLRRDHVRYPDGRESDYDIIVHSGAVTLVPVNGDGEIWFVRQYRHATGETLLELPAGTIDEEEQPEDCAERELREEIGYAAGSLIKIGEFYLAPGYSNELMHIFFASQLTYDPLQPDAHEFLQTEVYKSSDVFSMLKISEFKDAKTIAALCMVLPHLNS